MFVLFCFLCTCCADASVSPRPPLNSFLFHSCVCILLCCVFCWLLLGVQGVVFLVGLNGYNQRLFEDSSVNKMQESLNLFQQVPNQPAPAIATHALDTSTPIMRRCGVPPVTVFLFAMIRRPQAGVLRETTVFAFPPLCGWIGELVNCSRQHNTATQGAAPFQRHGPLFV